MAEYVHAAYSRTNFYRSHLPPVLDTPFAVRNMLVRIHNDVLKPIMNRANRIREQIWVQLKRCRPTLSK